MLPTRVTIKRGDTVVWRPIDVNEIHTVTFPHELHSDMVALCEGPGGTDIPATPTVIPTGPFDFACGKGPPDEVEFGGGNGVQHVVSAKTVSDSGIIGYRTAAAGYGVPANAIRRSWVVSFAGAFRGTYKYLCQIHEGMVGTIVVR